MPSGYNNATGEGKLFVLRANNGAAWQRSAPASARRRSPSGLAHIAGYSKDFRDQTVEQVYGGDLYGNVWRFDLSDPNPGEVAAGAARRADRRRQAAADNDAAQIEVDTRTASTVGCWWDGQAAARNDLPLAQQQTMYAMRDGSHDTPGAIGALTRADLGLVSSAAGLRAGVIATKGWYDDLPANARMIRAGSDRRHRRLRRDGPRRRSCKPASRACVRARIRHGQSVLADSGGNIVESSRGRGRRRLHVVAYDPSCVGDCIPPCGS